MLQITPQERTTLLLLANGISARELADRFGVTDGDMEARLTTLFAKMGAASPRRSHSRRVPSRTHRRSLVDEMMSRCSKALLYLCDRATGRKMGPTRPARAQQQPFATHRDLTTLPPRSRQAAAGSGLFRIHLSMLARAHFLI